MDLISVILPVYNCEKWIERCIKSIINQTYKNIQLIIINDGSKDNSLEICRKYENDKIVIINKQNSGVSETRNIGLERAEGKYIFFIDADDYIKNDCIENMYKKAKEYDADVVKSDNEQFDDKGTINKEKLFNNIYLYDLQDNKLKNQILNEMIETYKYNNVWGELILTEKAKKIKFDTNLAMGEDFLYNYNLYNICNKILVIPDEYYCYYFNKSGMNFNESIAKIKRKIEDTIYFYKEILKNPNGIEENKILQNFIKEIVLHIVMIANNKEISKKDKKQYLQNLLNNDIFKTINKKVKLEDIEFQNKRHKIVGKYLIKMDYAKLYMYLEYVYKPLKAIKLKLGNYITK